MKNNWGLLPKVALTQKKKCSPIEPMYAPSTFDGIGRVATSSNEVKWRLLMLFRIATGLTGQMSAEELPGVEFESR